MNSGKTIFSQLVDFLPAYEFRQCVERYNGNFKIKSFTCMDQFLCMAFAQLTYRESLRDIQACLRAAKQKLYHMGIRGKVSRNTMANANQMPIRFAIGEYMLILHKCLLAQQETFMQKMTSGCNWIKQFTLWMRQPSTFVCHYSLGQNSENIRGL